MLEATYEELDSVVSLAGLELVVEVTSPELTEDSVEVVS